MATLVRFAPSPTGFLHVGNVRTALVNYLFARKTGGRFMLRLDDTDQERSRAEYAEAIETDMRWLGLTWDEFRKQSDRLEAYRAAQERLMSSGRLYPCWETQEELDIRRKLQAGRGLPPVYDRASLNLTEEQKAKYINEGRKPHYRFRLEPTPIVWDDLVRGDVKFQAGHMSDPVLVREDGVPLYTLASVVDDGDMGVTHVIRGEDHVSNTAVQIQIFEALGYAVPRFAHLALLKTKEGELSKRVGGNDIRSLRADGIEPMTVNSLLAKIGTSDAIEPVAHMEQLVEAFDFAKFSRAPATYDAHDLERLNERLIAHLSYQDVVERIGGGVSEALWNAVRGNLRHLSEVQEWCGIIAGKLPPVAQDAFLAQALALLPPEPWDDATWPAWTKALAAASGKKGKELFMPLRLALTGKEHGPEMKALLPLMGYPIVSQRLKGC